MFRLALSIHIYFLFFETQIVTLFLRVPRNTWCGNPCFGSQKSSKYGTWYIVNGSFCYLCTLALCLALLILVTQCWRAPRRAKQKWSRFIGSCHVGVSKRFSRSISLAVYCHCTKRVGFARGKEIRQKRIEAPLICLDRWKICNYVYTRDFFVQSRLWMADWRNTENSTIDNNFGNWRPLSWYIFREFFPFTRPPLQKV